MPGLSLNVWATMLFCILAFFGALIWVLVYTLRQEETKLALFQTASKQFYSLHPETCFLYLYTEGRVISRSSEIMVTEFFILK